MLLLDKGLGHYSCIMWDVLVQSPLFWAAVTEWLVLTTVDILEMLELCAHHASYLHKLCSVLYCTYQVPTPEQVPTALLLPKFLHRVKRKCIKVLHMLGYNWWHSNLLCECNTPINVMLPYPHIGRWGPLYVGNLTERGCPYSWEFDYLWRHLENDNGLHILHSFTLCVKFPVICHHLQGDLLTGYALYIGAVDISPPGA